MESSRIEVIDDLVPIVRKYLVPQIERAVHSCITTHRADHYNDNYTFGTHLWKNIWNRITEITASEDTPIEPHGKGNEYKFRIGPFILRHHRVGGQYLLPRSAKSAKYEAIQLNLFGPTYPNLLPGMNVILSIEAEPEEGLKDIFLGELKQDSNTAKFCWEKEIPVYTPEELSILKGTGTKTHSEEEPIREVGYQPAEPEPGEFVKLKDDDMPGTKDRKTDA